MRIARHLLLFGAGLLLAGTLAAGLPARADTSVASTGVVPHGPYGVDVVYNVRYAAPAADTLIECKPHVTAGQWTGPFPAMLLIHGGAWGAGDNGITSSYSGRWCAAWASWGFVALSIGYTLQTADIKTHWPQALVEAQAAVRWVRANAAALNVNGGMIGAEGDSAGGQIALELAYQPTALPGNVAGDNPSFGSRPQFVISEFGPWTWGPSGPYQPGAPPPAAGSIATSVVVAAASGSRYNTADTLFVQGTLDNIVVPFESIRGYCFLLRNRRPAAYLSYVGGHEFTSMSPATWGSIVGQLQLRTIAFAYAHAHVHGGFPASVPGPGGAFQDPVPPKC